MLDADPQVLKKGYRFEGTNGKAVLIIHGFGGTPAEHYRTALALHAAGYTVDVPLLPGHGTKIEDLDKSSWHDWTHGVEIAYSSLHAKYPLTYVVGLSMGGLLSLYLAEQHPEIPALGVMAPALIYKSKANYLAPIILPFKRHLPYTSQFHLDEDSLALLSAGYNGSSVPAAIQMTRLQRYVHHHLKAITSPLIIFQSQSDEMVDPKTEEAVLKHISSSVKKGVMFEKTCHVMSLDSDREEIFKDILTFFQENHESGR